MADQSILAAIILKLSVALCLLTLALLVFATIVLKVVYEGKAHRPLPAKKPAVCWLPNFVFSLPLDARGSIEDELVSRLEDYEFDVEMASMLDSSAFSASGTNTRDAN